MSAKTKNTGNVEKIKGSAHGTVRDRGRETSSVRTVSLTNEHPSISQMSGLTPDSPMP